MKRTIALILALALVAGTAIFFASCSDKDNDVTTTLADETTVSENDKVTTTLADGTTVSEPVSEPEANGETTSAAPATTLPTVTAPVNGSVAQIVEFYNASANATKAYQGKMTVKRVQGTVSSLEDISIGLARGTVEGVLPNDYPKEKTVTFDSGKGTDGTKQQSFFPVDDKATASTLSAAGVKSAVCTADGTGSKVVITLVSENGNDINFVPKHHASCMDTLALTQEDLDPLTINEANITYTGATITAKIDANGRITSWVISEPVTINGKVALGSFNLITVSVLGTWKQNYTITY